MKVSTIIGLQFGDEGKGKITDYLSEDYDIIVRYQGGDNAGHSIQINDKKYHLRIIPSGVFKNKIVVIGNGVVLNPKVLLEEIEYLSKNNIDVKNLFISSKCHIIMPYHIAMDELNEKVKSDNQKIGTTKKGIGPTYCDKYDRLGIRIQDLFDLDLLKQKISASLTHKNFLFEHHKMNTYNVNELANEFFAIGQKLKDYIVDSTLFLNKSINDSKSVLFEGAQGAMLDIEFGTYPYVTSSSPLTGITQGSGVPFNKLNNSIGIIKSYLTRVGNGPMVTEFENNISCLIREKGNEYGTVTKRPRRIGWLDLPNLKYTSMIAGTTELVITLLDVLSGLKEIKICTHYLDGNNNEVYDYSDNPEFNSKLKPVYVTFEGWQEDISKISKFSQLPNNAKKYLKFIQDHLNINISYVSVGAERKQTIKVNQNDW